MAKNKKTSVPMLATALLLAGAAGQAAACASCGCSMSSDAAMGYSDTSGWRFNVEYDYINQDQLRSGSGSVSQASVANINNAGGNQEVENQTINRYINFGISYKPNADWGISALIPYIDRSHSTYGAATTDQLTPDNLSSATSSGLGDIKLIGSWQGLLPTHNLGFQLGIKLPTGNYGGQNTATNATVGHSPVFFSAGPNAGSALDTSLNTGTGSTDLIVGMFYYQPISQNFDAFFNAQYQSAVMTNLNQPNADFRPGTQTNVSFGVRYEANPLFVPQLQINITNKTADHGALADEPDTAGVVSYLSPGITATIVKNVQAYGFIQLPLYSKLEGYQLAPRWTASVGLSYAY